MMKKLISLICCLLPVGAVADVLEPIGGSATVSTAQFPTDGTAIVIGGGNGIDAPTGLNVANNMYVGATTDMGALNGSLVVLDTATTPFAVLAGGNVSVGAMLQVLDRFKCECAKKKKLLCVAILDIDFFKKVNDTYGHDAGDAVLKDLADLLLIRENEVPGFCCARWGGEEFVLAYLADSDGKEKIIKELEYIRQSVEEKSVEYNGMTIRHTMTIGAAFYDGTGDADSLITEADQRLYKGKESTRNCVVWK